MEFELTPEQIDFCKSMSFLFWWKKPEELPAMAERVLAGVMDRGGIQEWSDMERLFPQAMIINALETAVCGEFHAWSWRLWRLRYKLDANAPLPSRLPGLEPPKGEPWQIALQKQREPIDLNDPAQRLAWTKDLRRS